MKSQAYEKALATCAFVLLAVVPELAQAETNGRGRFPDGSAYRTNSEGIQLVDHVAELEVSAEESKRQLEAANNEIHRRDIQIEELQRAASAPVSLRCPPQPQLICPEPEVTREMLSQSEGEIKKLQDEVRNVRQDADAEKLKLSRDSSKSSDLIQVRDQEISLLRARLKIADEQVTFLKSLNGVSKNDSVRASVTIQQSVEPQTRSLLASRQPLPADEQKVRQQTLESYRKGVRAELTQVRELIQQRDALFSQYASTGKSLQIKANAAHSSQNRGLEQLQRDVETETSLRMVALMGREVKEIREKISEDIELVKRIGKL